MKKPLFPPITEMTETREKIGEKLNVKAINRYKNAGIKEGYSECLRILDERIANPDNKYFKPETEEEVEISTQIYREQLKGIDKLKSQTGRSIAVMCVDYLNGQITADTLLKIPIKTR